MQTQRGGAESAGEHRHRGLSSIREAVSRTLPYRLAVNGDWLERRCWQLFIRTEFPAYERFWLLFVAPLTNRDTAPGDIHFKSDADLASMKPPRSSYDLYLAQLNYSVLWHLAAVQEHRIAHGTGGWDTNSFVYAVIRLCSALDAADEMLQVIADGTLPPDPWKSALGARRTWRTQHPPPTFLRELQDYRHQLVHSGPFMHTEWGPYFPKVGMHRDYRDWRRATSPLTLKQQNQFAIAGAIVQGAWNRVTRYLERSWRAMLKARGVHRLRLPSLDSTAIVSQDASSTILSTTTPNFSLEHITPFDYRYLDALSGSSVVTSSATPESGLFRLWNPAGNQPPPPPNKVRPKRKKGK
jgi:hypothetical protein